MATVAALDRDASARGPHVPRLAVGRVVMKGQKAVRLVAAETIDDAGKVTNIKPVSGFDVTQTQELPARAA